MKLYFAGAESNTNDLIEVGAKRWLIAYPNKKSVIYKNSIELFLDCGAYSAFTRNKQIKHQEYIEFLMTHKL